MDLQRRDDFDAATDRCRRDGEIKQSEEVKIIKKELLDYLFFKENIILINTLTCMFATSLNQENVDQLSEALLRGFKVIKPKLDQLYQEKL